MAASMKCIIIFIRLDHSPAKKDFNLRQKAAKPGTSVSPILYSKNGSVLRRQK
jgi:hypothetical protein